MHRCRRSAIRQLVGLSVDVCVDVCVDSGGEISNYNTRAPRNWSIGLLNDREAREARIFLTLLVSSPLRMLSIRLGPRSFSHTRRLCAAARILIDLELVCRVDLQIQQ